MSMVTNWCANCEALGRQLDAERQARSKAEAACATLREGIRRATYLASSDFILGDLEALLAAPDPGADLLAVLRDVGKRGADARAMLRQYGIVFDKWPCTASLGERWTPQNVAALDPEVRWQGVAFTQYSMLCEVESAVERLRLSEGEKDDA